MKLKDIGSFEGWQIVRDNFIDPLVDLHKQTELLTEDMFQAQKGQVPQNIVIDIGWYGESFSTNGKFKIYVIRNQDWTIPIFEYSSMDPKSIVTILKEIVKLVNGLEQT